MNGALSPEGLASAPSCPAASTSCRQGPVGSDVPVASEWGTRGWGAGDSRARALQGELAGSGQAEVPPQHGEVSWEDTCGPRRGAFLRTAGEGQQASPEQPRSGVWQGIVRNREAGSLFNAIFSSSLSDETHRKGRTQPWTFPYCAAVGMLHHVLQPCSEGGLSPGTRTVALQVALPQKGAPPGSKEQDRAVRA